MMSVVTKKSVEKNVRCMCGSKLYPWWEGKELIIPGCGSCQAEWYKKGWFGRDMMLTGADPTYTHREWTE
jgi:hypothetical protein